jgi:hypothetical protein
MLRVSRTAELLEVDVLDNEEEELLLDEPVGVVLAVDEDAGDVEDDNDEEEPRDDVAVELLDGVLFVDVDDGIPGVERFSAR